jgi:hypothetical protein
MHAYFNRFIISMKKTQAAGASHQGQCIDDVRDLLENKSIERQLNKIDPDDIRAELEEYGAWEREELSDNAANRERIIWIAAGNIIDELYSRKD